MLSRDAWGAKNRGDNSALVTVAHVLTELENILLRYLVSGTGNTMHAILADTRPAHNIHNS